MESIHDGQESCSGGEPKPAPAGVRLELDGGVSTSHRQGRSKFYKHVSEYGYAELKRLPYEKRLLVPGYVEAQERAASINDARDPFEGLS